MAVEREIKLSAVNGDVLQRLARELPQWLSPGVSAMRQQQVVDDYVDSVDLALLHRWLALRLRWVDGAWRVTLKGNGGVVDGVSIRQEWEEECGNVCTRPVDLPEGEIRQRVLSCLPPAMPWQTLMSVTMRRRLLDVVLEDGCQIELALDEGRVEAGGKGRNFWEVELEAKSGPFHPVSRLAAAMVDHFGLTPANHSKFTLGLQLLGIQLKDLPPAGVDRAIH